MFPYFKKHRLLFLNGKQVQQIAWAAVSTGITVLLILFLFANQNWFKDEGSNNIKPIQVSDFKNPKVKNSGDLVRYAQYALNSRWGYLYGTYGQILDQPLLESRQRSYPSEVTPYLAFIQNNWVGKRVTDCAGLIKGYGWLNPETGIIQYAVNGVPDLSANGMYQAAAEKGDIGSIPDVPGLAVWQDGHIGIYVGNGEVIEAMTTTRGVVKTKLKDRGWTAWLKITWITYES